MLKGKIPSVWGFSYFNVRLKTIGQWSPSENKHTDQPVCSLLTVVY